MAELQRSCDPGCIVTSHTVLFVGVSRVLQNKTAVITYWPEQMSASRASNLNAAYSFGVWGRADRLPPLTRGKNSWIDLCLV